MLQSFCDKWDSHFWAIKCVPTEQSSEVPLLALETAKETLFLQQTSTVYKAQEQV